MPFSPHRSYLLVPLFASLVGGCAASRTSFYENTANISDTRICRTLDAAWRSGDQRFADDVRAEADRRALSPARCQSLVRTQNAIIAGAAVVGTAILVANNSNSSVGVGAGIGIGTTIGDGPYIPAGPVDTDWDWDLFYNHSARQDQWGCRGVQSGQFSEPARCSSKAQSDWRWPGTR